MKNKIPLLAAVFSLIFLLSFQSEKVKAQSAFRDVIVYVQNMSEKEYLDVVNMYSGFQGVTVKGYCESLQCFVLRIDANLYSEYDSSPLQPFAASNYRYEIKQGGTFEKLQQACVEGQFFPVTISNNLNNQN